MFIYCCPDDRDEAQTLVAALRFNEYNVFYSEIDIAPNEDVDNKLELEFEQNEQVVCF